MSLIRTRLGLNQFVQAPSVYQPAGPVCMTCGKVVPYEAIVDVGKTWARVLVRCHGAEELAEFDFGTEHWGYDELRAFRMRKSWFDPMAVREGVGVQAHDQTAAHEQDIGKTGGDVIVSLPSEPSANAA